MSSVSSFVPRSRWGWLAQLKCYWDLIKDLQTGLLVLTAVAGYLTGCCTNLRGGSLAGLTGSLFLAVGGCTILNMVYDRDIDARMRRTAGRPLPAGRISPTAALALGAVLSASGVAWAVALDPLYGGVVLAGLLLDAGVYTVWLKRRTPYSILWGGLAGSMPALAGRVLAVGRIDDVGLLLALGVLLWIPTHMLTFGIRHAEDYRQAGVPTFPEVYGVHVARVMIAVSTLLAVAAFWTAGSLVGLPPGLRLGSGGLGGLLVALVLVSLIRPRPRLNFVLYKGASLYMLGTMLVLILGGL